MKRIMSTLIAIAVISISANAQPAEKKREFDQHKKHHHGMMAKELNFTDAQKQQAKANAQSFKQKMQELNKNDQMTVKEYREKKEALRKEQKASMENLLTSDQKAKLQKMKVDHMAKREAHYSKHLDKMKTNLNLSDEQVVKMKENRESFKNKFKAIRENGSLDATQKKEQLMTLKKDQREKMESLFTKEQKDKIQEMKKKHSDKHGSVK